MLRALLAVIACLCLTGCWVSEGHLFGSGDWAHLDLAGTYSVESANGDAPETATLTVQESGLIEAIPADASARPDDIQGLGLVAIPGGTGRFFLAVDQSSRDADMYYIARLSLEGDLALYLPDCAGTSAREGMVIEEESKGGLTCVFASKEALLAAALDAERFLSARHIIAVAPIYSLERMQEPDYAEEDD